MLLFSQKTTGNPSTFQNAGNDYIWRGGGGGKGGILPHLYWCETQCLTLKTECKLRVFVNTVLNNIPVHMMTKVSTQFRKLCNEHLCVYTNYQLLLQ